MILPIWAEPLGEDLYQRCVEAWPYGPPYEQVLTEERTADHAVATIMIGVENEGEMTDLEKWNILSCIARDGHDRGAVSDFFDNRDARALCIEGMERVVRDYYRPSEHTEIQNLWLSLVLYEYSYWSDKTLDGVLNWMEAMTDDDLATKRGAEIHQNLASAILYTLSHKSKEEEADVLMEDVPLTLRDRLAREAIRAMSLNADYVPMALSLISETASDDLLSEKKTVLADAFSAAGLRGHFLTRENFLAKQNGQMPSEDVCLEEMRASIAFYNRLAPALT